VGVLIDRAARSSTWSWRRAQLFLPDVGRLRAARGRFRGLRLVHTHLRGEPLTHDDLTDLALLRLDLVAAIGVERGGAPGRCTWPTSCPQRGGDGGAAGPCPSTGARAARRLRRAHRIARGRVRAHRRSARRDGRARTGLVVHVSIGRRHDSEGRIAEIKELCRTAGVRVLDVLQQARPAADPKTLIGKGKLEQVVLRAMQLGAEVVIFDTELTPGQARTISDFTELKVLDRTMLILDIFAQRAQSRDGKLQVELAQLRYTLPRLVEKNTMMSRLTGGIGGRGPGETKLEISRRRARERIQHLESRSRSCHARRLRREQRGTGVPIRCVDRRLHQRRQVDAAQRADRARVLVEDKLFATLDPTSRRLRVPDGARGRHDRHRRLHPRPAQGPGQRLPRHARGAGRGRPLLHVVDAGDPDHPEHIRCR
jgi:GTP-binding protein HflX